MVKQLFLYSILLNVVCLSAMDFHEHNDAIHQAKKDEAKDEIITIKLTEDERASLFADSIHRRIDEEILQISPNVWFKSIVGSVRSYYYGKDVLKEKAAADMSTIESYIKFDNKELVLRLLARRHWYVNYLLEALIAAKFEEISKIKGSTVDLLCNLGDVNGFKRLVHKMALKDFCEELSTDVVTIPMRSFDDIHFIALDGQANFIVPSSLVMSGCSQYLKGSDFKFQDIIWDMQKGQKTSLLPEEYQKIEWKSGCMSEGSIYGVTDKTATYFAISIINNETKQRIMLFKRPQELSYLAQIAFKNSRHNHKELSTLLNSNSFKQIEGFPKDNLKKLIEANMG